MGHAQQAAMLERSRMQEEARLDTQKALVNDRIQVANMLSEERVENKRFLRQLQMEDRERQMEEAILKVRKFISKLLAELRARMSNKG